MARYYDPYKRLEKAWEAYKSNAEAIKTFLEKIYYDGYQKNCFESSERMGEHPQYHILEPKRQVLEQVFLLPSPFIDMQWRDVLKPVPPPEFPQPVAQPPIKLGNSEYPDWYRLQFIERDVTQRTEYIEQMSQIVCEMGKKRSEFQTIFARAEQTEQEIIRGIEECSVKANELLVGLANKRQALSKFLCRTFEITIDPSARVAVVELEFPDYTSEGLIVGYKTARFEDIPKFATDAARKKYIRICLYSMTIRAAYIAAHYVQSNNYETVVVNVSQEWFDPATGQPRNGVIASLQASVDYLKTLDLSRLDPEACFRYLKGIATPSLQHVSIVRPILTLNKSDDRVVVTRDVDSEAEPEANLAAMEWDDFEHLVAQLFEWEFAKQGVEVRVTRASRDRGVDAILYDPDPLRGGKYVLQAKRYTRTVDVSAVRDLYGTVMNEGANRGILITTAAFGPDAYDFAKDKPISMVDGPNLLLMLQRHGKRYRIDLEEARRLNSEI